MECRVERIPPQGAFACGLNQQSVKIANGMVLVAIANVGTEEYIISTTKPIGTVNLIDMKNYKSWTW